LTYRLLFNDGELGASAARNLSIKQARGDIIAFVDDDVLLFPDWAEEMIKTYEDASIIGVTGPAFPLWQDKPVSWFPEEFYWIIGCTAWLESEETREVRNVWTMNASFRRETFDKGTFFSTTIGPRGGSMKGREKNKISEDLEFSMRAREKTGKRIVYNPKVKVKHRVPNDRLSWRYIIQWSYWIGASRKALKRLYPEDKGQASVLNTEYDLLKRIFTRLFPDILMGFAKNPIIGYRKFVITITVLSCVAFGYLLSALLSPWQSQKNPG
jgi:GT2 family glycosyltransferase